MTTAKALPRAATVLVLRAAPASSAPATVGDVEVLLVQRNSRASFMAGAYVFPGGRVDPADLETAAKSASASESVPLRAARHAAARELEEEVGLVVSELSLLQRFAHWITPSAEPKRFDTEFFTFALLPQTDGQLPSLSITGTEVAKNAEVGAPLWLSPQAALQRYLQGQLNLPPPTACTLEELAAELELVKAQNQDCTAPE
ncbi:MAG: NUDIX hydrolase, partial [Deltaproteobacteria bacterium]|nr:NUDIX hydrolase [Deltaproteobacteria bacterium]